MARPDVLYAPSRSLTGLPARSAARRIPTAPVVGTAAQLTLLAVLAELTGLGPVGWLAGIAYALAVGVLLTLSMRRGGVLVLGPADHVTLARTTLAGGVTALVANTVHTPAPLALLVAITAVALILDAVDGQVARRTGTVSSLGARFDMEADAFLILVLSIFVGASLGWWVPAIGVMRYVFAAATLVLPWLRTALPPSMARKTVAAAQGVVLLIVAAGVLPRAVAMAATGLALAALAWSFGRDVTWLHRRRHTSERPPVCTMSRAISQARDSRMACSEV